MTKEKCTTCGTPCLLGYKLCDGCWSIESHLEGYFRDGGDKAIRFVTDALEQAKREWVRRQLIAEVKTQQLSDNLDEEDREFWATENNARAYQVAIKDAVAVMRDLDLAP